MSCPDLWEMLWNGEVGAEGHAHFEAVNPVYAIFPLALPPHSLPQPWGVFGLVLMRWMLPSGVGTGQC